MPRNPSRRFVRAKAGTTGITSAGQAVITAADAAAIRTVLELVIGTHVLAPGGNGSALTGLTQSQISGLVAALAAKADASAMTSALASKADLSGGYILTSQIPAIAITEFLGTVSNQAEMLALSGDRGDWCIRTDAQTAYILTADDSTLVGSWMALPHPTSPVLSVNGQTGVIVLGATDVSAQPVDATLTALAAVTTSADKLIYATGVDTFTTTTLSSFARTFLDDADAAAVLSTLGVTSLLAGKGSNVGNNGFYDSAPAVGTIYWLAKSQTAFTINGLYGLKTTSGTATLSVKINGTAITGLSGITASSTSQDVVASGGNTVAIGDEVSVEYTSVSSPVDLRFNLKDSQ